MESVNCKPEVAIYKYTENPRWNQNCLENNVIEYIKPDNEKASVIGFYPVNDEERESLMNIDVWDLVAYDSVGKRLPVFFEKLMPERRILQKKDMLIT